MHRHTVSATCRLQHEVYDAADTCTHYQALHTTTIATIHMHRRLHIQLAHQQKQLCLVRILPALRIDVDSVQLRHGNSYADNAALPGAHPHQQPVVRDSTHAHQPLGNMVDTTYYYIWYRSNAAVRWQQCRLESVREHLLHPRHDARQTQRTSTVC